MSDMKGSCSVFVFVFITFWCVSEDAVVEKSENCATLCCRAPVKVSSETATRRDLTMINIRKAVPRFSR